MKEVGMRVARILCVAALLAVLTVAAFASGGTEAPAGVAPSAAKVNAPGMLPIVNEKLKLVMGITQSVRVADYEDNYMTNLLLKDTNIDLDFELLPADQPAQKFQLMVSAGQKLPDIVHYSFTDAVRAAYGKDGIFKPLNKYMDTLTYWYTRADMDKAEYDMVKILGTSPDGNMYGFPAYMNGLGDIVQYMMNINKVWLDKLGLKMPTTTDEFYQVLVAFRDRDPNGNGKKDEIPFLTSAGNWSAVNWHELINSFVYWDPWYNTSYFDVTNGKLWAPFITNEWRDAMRYLNKLVKEGLMSPLSFSMTAAEHKAAVNVAPGKDVIVGVTGGHYIVMWDSKNESVYQYDALPALAGPAGVRWQPTRTPNYQYSTFITKDNRNPEASFRMFDYWWEEKRSLITRYGEPGVHFDYYKDSADFTKKYPFLSVGAVAQNLPFAKHIQVPGVQNPWTSSEPHKAIWQSHFCCGLPSRTYSANAATAPVPNTWAEAKEKGWGTDAHWSYLNKSYYSLRAGKEPAEVAKRLLFTAEEEKSINDIRNTINSYVNETIALFATGTMNTEGDWDKYVKTLGDMGLQQYLATSQTAYDRMYKKK